MRCAEPTWAGPGTPRQPWPEVGRLLAAEPHVPGLPLLLDDGALRSWLQERMQDRRAVPSDVTLRPYLRWKPGAGGVARVDLGPGTGELFLAVWHRGSEDKLRKTVERGGPDCVVVDEGRMAVLAGPGADRDLPGLVRLRRRGGATLLRRLHPVDDDAARRLRRAAGAGDPVTLAWKPQRRWVGRAGAEEATDGGGAPQVTPAVVLRAQRPDAARASAQGYRTVRSVLGGAAPRLLGTDLRRGLLAVEHLTGTTLDRSVDDDRAEAAATAAGALLARLHSAEPRRPAGGPGAGGRPTPDERDLVRTAAAQLALLVPDAGSGAVAELVLASLDRLGRQPQVLVHGDLSADQVLVRPDGRVALLDLDEARRGEAAGDLAGAAAAWWLDDPRRAGVLVAALHTGYAAAGTLPAADVLRVRTAAHLLRRAAEPFRLGAVDWPGAVRSRVSAARDVLLGVSPAPRPAPGVAR